MDIPSNPLSDDYRLPDFRGPDPRLHGAGFSLLLGTGLAATAGASIKRSDFGVNYRLPAIGEVLDPQIELEASKN